MPYIGKIPAIGNYQVLDALTATTTDTYALTKGGVAVFPQTPANCIVSLNGVIQAPFSSYNISGSNIVFASALTGSDSIDFITVLGDVLNVGTVSDGTIGLAKLSATGTKDATTFLRGDNTFQTIGTNTPSFFARLSSNQSISGATDTKVQADTEEWDTDTAYDNSTNYRFTVPTGKGGKYVIIGSAEFDVTVENEYGRIRFHKNGSAVPNSEVRIVLDSAFPTIMKSIHIFDLTASDYLEMYIRTLSTGGDLIAGKTSFQGFKLI